MHYWLGQWDVRPTECTPLSGQFVVHSTQKRPATIMKNTQLAVLVRWLPTIMVMVQIQ